MTRPAKATIRQRDLEDLEAAESGGQRRPLGYLTFDPEADPRDEARRLADVMKRKYDEQLVATTGPPPIALDLAGAT